MKISRDDVNNVFKCVLPLTTSITSIGCLVLERFGVVDRPVFNNVAMNLYGAP
ncbi:hypothetical protein Plhal304r1_c012g0046471 [Plasmopara halstedii]